MKSNVEQNTGVLASQWLHNVIIRRLIFSDLPHLEWNGEYKHLRQVYLNAYKLRNEGKNVLWVADHPQKRIIGQVFIQLDSVRKDIADGFSCAYLFAFRIKPEYRNAGLGTRILKVVEEDLSKRNYHEISLNVAKANLNAIRFYSRLGYEIVGSESGEWSYRDHLNNMQHVVEPAWKMLKTISKNVK